MAMTLAKSGGEPLGEMNTTPLIDVMLVLLIMFIMVIPTATHSVDIDMPAPCLECRTPPLDQVKNKITIDAEDRVLWNGQPVDGSQLAALLVASQDLPREPELQFEPSARASYDASARTMATIKASGVTHFGFVGNERFRDF